MVNEGIAFALQAVRPSGASVDYLKWQSYLPKGEVIIVSPVSTFVLITLRLELSAFCFSFSFFVLYSFLKSAF